MYSFVVFKYGSLLRTIDNNRTPGARPGSMGPDLVQGARPGSGGQTWFNGARAGSGGQTWFLIFLLQRFSKAMIETVHDNIGLYKKIENTNISINNK